MADAILLHPDTDTRTRAYHSQQHPAAPPTSFIRCRGDARATHVRRPPFREKQGQHILVLESTASFMRETSILPRYNYGIAS